ncbi:serine hydrolase [Desulfosediminicola flagellatus]|uniref:serine hydrolase n=1 Tax=Desulfosediminicola flagellatus TaxID=2569541 RepID=UPI0010AC1FC8|nr:serine hydrolase [Desulfosediminicola flagellatus]
MKRCKTLFSALFLLLGYLLISPVTGVAENEQYDLVYIWDTDIENVLDYKEKLEEIFDDAVSKRLKIVGRGDEYGVIYDTNGSARTVGQDIAYHGEILRKEGLDEAWAIRDEGYHLLYNVSYGLGPNLDSLKKTYEKLYKYLGEEVGKNLLIEKTHADNYALIYRRRGDRKTTMAVAQKHRKLLRSKKIRTSITAENNNEIVYGESSLLDDGNDVVDTSPIKMAIVIRSGNSTDDTTDKRNPDPVVISLIKKDKSKRVVSVASRTAFEMNVEDFIKELRRTGKIRSDEKTGWMVYDLENDRSLLDINANEIFQAASMIKPFVALAFFHQVKNGKLTYGPKSKRMLEAMIQRSSNSATNWVIRQAGGPAKCQQILRQYYSSIFKNTVIKEYIPAGGRTYKNSALPSDYIRFLRAMWNKELPYGKELRRIMALPGRDRLYHGTPIPQGTLVYNKTGSTAHLCGDMGILVPKTAKGQRYPYAIVGIIERSSRPSDYGRWMLARGNVIRQVSTLVYEEMKKQHSLL